MIRIRLLLLAPYLLPVLAWPAQSPKLPALDVVLLLQSSAGLNRYYGSTDFSGLAPHDRVAVVTFTKKANVKLHFTGDLREAQKTVHSLQTRRIGIWAGKMDSNTRPRLWDALMEACNLIGGRADHSRRGEIVVLFAGEDGLSKATDDDVRRALINAHVTLSAAGVAAESPVFGAERQAQTPPAIGPSGPPVTMKRGPLPDRTLDAIRRLAAATYGSVARGEWNLTGLIEHARGAAMP